jgi:hypothetical protein
MYYSLSCVFLGLFSPSGSLVYRVCSFIPSREHDARLLVYSTVLNIRLCKGQNQPMYPDPKKFWFYLILNDKVGKGIPLTGRGDP